MKKSVVGQSLSVISCEQIAPVAVGVFVMYRVKPKSIIPTIYIEIILLEIILFSLVIIDR